MKKSKGQDKKRGYLQFFAVIFIAGVFGGISGGLASFFEQDMMETARVMERGIQNYAPRMLIVLGILGSIVTFVLVQKVRRDIRIWNQDDEEQTEKMERFNNRSQAVITVLVIVNMFMGFISGKAGRQGVNPEYMLGMGTFIFFALWCAFAINILVECMKKMNPEKRGNALSLHFDKEWLESCDEQEKARMYEAAYRVYVRSQYLYSGLFIFFVVVSTGVDIGVLPFFVVGFIWIAQSITYHCAYEKI